jgi:hypothetical protein
MCPVATRPDVSLNLESLVHHMFDQVLDESERAELMSWIRRWEAANPGVDAAHRVTGWIDVAYEFQSRGGITRDEAVSFRADSRLAVVPRWVTSFA